MIPLAPTPCCWAWGAVIVLGTDPTGWGTPGGRLPAEVALPELGLGGSPRPGHGTPVPVTTSKSWPGGTESLGAAPVVRPGVAKLAAGLGLGYAGRIAQCISVSSAAAAPPRVPPSPFHVAVQQSK